MNISIKHILSEVNQEELHRFVKRYASTDQKFNLLMKAHFVHLFEAEELRLLLEGIFSSILKSKIKPTDKITRSQFSLLSTILDELYAQAEDKLAMEQYQSCSIIIEVALDRINYAMGSYHVSSPVMAHHYTLFHQLESQLLEQDIAPELYSSIFRNIEELSQKSYYQFLMPYNIIDIISSIKKSYAIRLMKSIQDTLEVKILNLSRTDNDILNLAAYIKTCYYTNSPLAPAVIQDSEVTKTKDAYELLLINNEYSSILHSIHALSVKGYYEQHFDEIIIKTYEAFGDRPKLQVCLYDAFFKYQDYRYFDKLKRMSSKPLWAKYHLKILAQLSPMEQPHFYAQFLKKENNTKDLADHLRVIGDWQLIKDFSFYLYEKDQHLLEKVYQSYIDQISTYPDSPEIVEKQTAIYRFIGSNIHLDLLKKIRSYVENKQRI